MRNNEADTKTSALPVCAPQASRLTAYDPMTAASESERPWPFKSEDSSPLTWWRRLPSDTLVDAELLLVLLTTLEQIDVLHDGDDFAAALNGDPAAAIGVTFSMMPIEEMTLRAGIVMTALLKYAIERNAAAALVLAQVLGLTDLGHPYASEPAKPWLVHGRRCSNSPDKFGEAETVLLAAFRERPRDGDNA